MRFPQLLIHESDGRLANSLRDQARESRWALREPRHQESCFRLLERGGPAILVLKVGRDLERELTLLEQVTRRFPDTWTIVVGDADHRQLAGLAWDLGARYVLFPPQMRELLPAIVKGFIASFPRLPRTTDKASQAPARKED